MSEKDTVFSGKIKQTGIFSFKDFYTFLYDWLRDENYDVYEKKYTEKVKGDTKEIEIRWEAERDISDYFRFKIEMNWLLTGVKSIEVQKDGRKEKMDSAAMEIKFKAILIKDYEDRWENAPFWKFLRGLYERYIIRQRISDYEIKLLQELEELLAQAKSFLALEGQR
ncbi:MAG: hypothetical protein Q8N99_02150 [Nanoarchaeota archaeon]|nr:hypothetical protein [Nanoarchaeota archaeon]